LPPRQGALAAFVILMALAVTLAGCATVTVKPAAITQRFEAMDRTAINSDRPSELTLAFLKQRDLDGEWAADPEGLIARLDAKYHADPGVGTLFALVELSHLQAKRLRAEPEKAASYDLACAVYSYLFLFDPKAAPPRDTFRPNARIASEFHNRSLSRYLIYARSAGIRFHPGERLSMVSGPVELVERQSGLPFHPEEFSGVHLAFEFAVSGLDVTYSAPGLGAPLILVRESATAGSKRPQDRFLSRIRQVVAGTLYLRIETEPVRDADGARVYKSRLELHDPMRVNSVQIDGVNVPLETDTTTPLAWMAATAPSSQSIGLKGLMNPEAMKANQGLFMLQPYQPDKIPVVFVHGLISSPLTWLPMLNGLMGDPELRERYQFWYFSYPTGNPVFYSAATLREALLNARAAFDPAGTNPAFNNMLIVGHSMGGLLTKAMVQESGERQWNLFSKTPYSEMNAPRDTLALLEKVIFYKPLPFVTEAVFIATPHRGSEMALGAIGSIGRALVTLPLTLARASASILASLASAGHKPPITGMPTGIDSLSPKNIMLREMAAMPVGVPFHSIMGNEAKAGATGGTDGVVPYWSSHLNGARSELIVKSGHGAHEHPLAIREVRRIMLEHAGIGVAAAPRDAARGDAAASVSAPAGSPAP
jgi:pimeloyl-ACP methyl ester carboxylesterase